MATVPAPLRGPGEGYKVPGVAQVLWLTGLLQLVED